MVAHAAAASLGSMQMTAALSRGSVVPSIRRVASVRPAKRLTRAEIHMARLTRAEFCARAPKVELHVHLDGAFDSAYLFECATKYVEDLPATVNLLGGKSFVLQ